MLDDRRPTVIEAAIMMVAALPFVWVPVADPFQPGRALAAGVLFAVAVMLAGPGRDSRESRSALVIALLLAVIFAIAAVVGGLPSAVYGVHGRYQGLVLGALVLGAGAAGMLVPGSSVRWLARGCAAAMLLAAGMIFVQGGIGAQPVALLGNRVVAGGWVAMVTSVLAAGAALSSGRARIYRGSTAVIGLLALGMIGSRGAWVGMLAGAAVITVGHWHMRSRRVQIMIAGVAGAILILIGATLAGPASSAKLDPAALSTGSGASRMAIWRDTTAMIEDNPVFGVGPGRFIYEYPAYQSLAHARAEAETRPDQAHSLVLHAAAEAGLVAALALIVLSSLAVYVGARAVRRRDATALIALAGFAAYLGQGMFGVSAVEIDSLGWLLGGVLLARAGTPDATEGRGAAFFRAAHGAARIGVLAMLVGAVVASGVYLAADAAHARSLTHFSTGALEAAGSESRSAIARNPLIDVYRVGLADVALYRRGVDVGVALNAVREGLRLEPDSYDLALAAARLTEASGAEPKDVAAAYERAVELWPLGVTVRTEAARAYDAAGRSEDARTLRLGMRELGVAVPGR